jgi:8-hydroxy-5-deazaflavin:NADPH oxidoreductase
MRIAILGSGNVGGTLGRAWAVKGHTVVFGLRDPSKGAAAVKGGDALPAGASTASVLDAVRGADVVLVATPWSAAIDALRDAGSLDGVTIIDATNPIGPGFSLQHGPDGESAAERIQAAFPSARVVKAFNSTGANNMAQPSYDGVPTAMFFAGDDVAAKATVRTLVDTIGFEALDAGPLLRSRELESLATLWIELAYGGGMTRDFAFRVVRR